MNEKQMKITLNAMWILDSRSQPTVQCSATVYGPVTSFTAKASVPSGASTGAHEALELRDTHKAAFNGKGVTQAVQNIEFIQEKLAEKTFSSAQEVDTFILSLDSSENKHKLGANAILGVSMAVHRAFAMAHEMELWQYLSELYFEGGNQNLTEYPKLMCNIINGGVHADSGLAFQEFMVIPNTGSVQSDVQASCEIYNALKSELKEAGQSIALGDEGGFAPRLAETKEALTFIVNSVSKTAYTTDQYSLALDCAASEYMNEDGTYTVDNTVFTGDEMVQFLKELAISFNIESIEDAFGEDDIENWKKLKRACEEEFYQIGDDLFVTNVKRFETIALEHNAASGVLIKLNQIGSVLETCNMINLAHKNGYVCAISHRSGETTDDFIADLAVASSSKYIKLGAPARGERVAKYNRLLEIYS